MSRYNLWGSGMLDGAGGSGTAASFEDAINRFNKATHQSVKYEGTGWMQIGFELKNAKGEYGTKDGVSGFMYTTYIGNGSGDVVVGKRKEELDMISKEPNQEKLSIDQLLANWGAEASALENFSGMSRLGSNFKLYTATTRSNVFMGNQYVKTLGLAKFGKAVGSAGVGIGIGVGIYKVANHQESLGKFGSDTAMGAFGLTGIGTIPSLMYFSIDAYYPGGVVKFNEDNSNAMYKIYKSDPGANYYGHMMGF